MTDPEQTMVTRVLRPLRSARRRLTVAVGLAGLGIAATLLIMGAGGGGSGRDRSGTGSGEGGLTVIRSTDSSWVPGQGSLAGYGAFLAVDDRAEELGRGYQRLRDEEVARQERLADLRRNQARQAARRRALAAYRAALRRAAQERKRQQRELAERRRRLKEKLKRLREKYKVEPGEECQIPEVQQLFDCSTGYPF